MTEEQEKKDVARIHILNTGGTLGMEEDPETGALRPAKSAEELVKGLNISKDVRLTLEDHPRRLDSTNVTYEDRALMAEAIAQKYDDHDAFVILHGTDSIAYTTSGITMIFKESLQKPIIVVGSQMHKSEQGTDMRNQLENAIRIAVEFSRSRNKVAGVFSVANTDVFKGARLRKTHDSSFCFLDTPGVHPVAAVEQPQIEVKHDLVRLEDGRVNLKRYELGQKAAKAGAISLESLTPEMADAKFRQAIAQYPNDPGQIQRFISVDFDGELLRGHKKVNHDN